MGHKRTPTESAAQKARTAKNKQKPPKKRQFQSEEKRKKKLEIKAVKRQKYYQRMNFKKKDI